MSYKALYRIYRPQDFNEVAGQKHITTTLKNALVNDKVAHAYLFSGPRGTGKTSIAKIFAKAVNCVKAPTENPCNECENCKGIQSGVISDIIEIDAASNNGVDEIREIRDKVKYLPGYVKYKVYIIDEVHMLSTGAFNALLKTLEEPPQHVIFILCTTEPQKIPLTIHSRCQRFDFKSITTKDIISKLKEIVELEKLNIEEEALAQIAIHAEGGLRDAISLLDQASSYSPEKITLDDVNQISGAVSAQMLIGLAEALVQGNSTKAIELLDALITEGKEVKKINMNLIEFFRDILMARNLRNLDENNYLYKDEQFIQLSKMISNKMTLYILDVLINAANEIKWSNSPKIYLELAFIKITDNEVSSSSRIISMIDDLENRLSEVEKIKEDVDNYKEKESENRILEIVNKAEETEEKDLLEDINIEEQQYEDELDEETPQEVFEKQLCDDIDETYSIEFVESILNNGDRQDKSILINKWNNISKTYSNDEEKYIAQILETGTVVASAVNKIIITFPSVSICNKLMNDSNKKFAINILARHYNRKIDFIALPDSVFTDITDEFKALWTQNKGGYINLSKIRCEGLVNVNKEVIENETETKPKIVTDALDLFGDIVKVKK
ncbi:DNA polymerase III subunit gamma/tau [Candidatus Izemoplasma sp. B36]|uniref:DNA polymerase III subunit gamma/tau n=1 Tax=Candidatus Izemoplasma sp. B36 TaxID=3242468 RepID=UPI003558D394